MKLGDGLIAVVKRDCPTCELVVDVLTRLRREEAGQPLTIVCQDDPEFPPALDPVDDRELAISWQLNIETVPTLLRLQDGEVSEQSQGWHREQWRAISGIDDLGADLPELRPGCGSRTLEPLILERLRRRQNGALNQLHSRKIEIGELEDAIEACFARGWTDGLPVVPPTPERVDRMLAGTSRAADEIVTRVPPDYAECTIEKIAINSVAAGCRPEYLPVVIAAVEAACTEEFNYHGLAATTFFSGPVVVVNGPIVHALGMNSGMNALGQGNRANATIGRALQLVLRNVGGSRPGEVDRATLGNPGKLTFCFAENEEDSPWSSLATERGAAEGASAVTLFAGGGPRGVVDQLSRGPESLARSLAWCLRTVAHPKLAIGFDAMVVITPEHGRVFGDAGWSKDRLRREIAEILTIPAAEMVRGAGGCDEGLPPSLFTDLETATVPKFRPDGLWFVHAGGKAGLFSAIIGGWINGPGGSQPATCEVRP